MTATEVQFGDDQSPLLASEFSQSIHGSQDVVYALYPKRWYILTVYSIATFTQCLIWLTFSAIPDATMAYFPTITEAEIDLLLNWGSIIFIPAVLIAMWLDTKLDFRATMITGCCLACLGSAIRCIPCFLPAEHRNSAVAALHIGQILNAAAGGFIFSMPSRLSAVLLQLFFLTSAFLLYLVFFVCFFDLLGMVCTA